MTSPSSKHHHGAADADLEQNVTDLGRVISSEARGTKRTEQAMVGWTIVNRMKQKHARRVSEVWHGYSHSHFPDHSTLQLARAILTGRERDISQGATHFYTPNLMPKEGEATAGFDVHDGLESTPGVTDRGKPVRNYQPGWARDSAPLNIPGVNASEFKFYALPP